MRTEDTLSPHHRPTSDEGEFRNIFKNLSKVTIFLFTSFSLVILTFRKTAYTINLAGFLSVSALCVSHA